ncbi:hypothetical protein [Anaeromyxobacter dehalogenans]|uniref:hypothetical protein n=1 Tax=Anaeromyxobacter dehalogenans TaxID=161493 RepID=UPI00059C8DB8|nr:hypothetical protein [Anaeromyxobacter dehalogenans]
MKRAHKQFEAEAASGRAKQLSADRGRERSRLDARALALPDGPRLERVRASIRTAFAQAQAADGSGADALTSMLLDVGLVEFALKQSGQPSRLPDPEMQLTRLISAAAHLERVLDAVEREVGSDLASQPRRGRHAVTPA